MSLKAGSTPGVNSQGNEILVAVAEPTWRTLIADLLGDEGFTVTAAAEGLTALRAFDNRRFELIVAATDLPGSLDALAIIRRVRRRQPWLRALYTGAPASRPVSAHLDTDDFIAMPFERSELIGCVFELLHRPVGWETADLSRRVRPGT